MLATTHDNELDTGPRSGAGRERLCVATRTVKPVDEMIRFVVGPDGGRARPQAQAARPRRLGHRDQGHR